MPTRATAIALLSLSGLLLGAPLSAQTIRPIISEYENKAQGKFELVNDGDRPLNVVMMARGFTVDERGEMRDAPLDPGLHLKLSATSLRIPARQNRWVFYEATAERSPSWFVVYASFSALPQRGFSGINVQLELPHIVYILPKTRWVASDVQVTAVQFDREKQALVVDLENQGTQFGRLTDVEVQADRQKVRVPGFALFPGVRRRVEIPWEPDEDPGSIVIKARDFSFERKLPLDTP